jgi:hypothetical protein
VRARFDSPAIPGVIPVPRAARDGDREAPMARRRGDAADMMAAVGRHCGWTAVMGVLSIVAGLVLLAYPGLSLLTLAILLSVWLLVLGRWRSPWPCASGPPRRRS